MNMRPLPSFLPALRLVNSTPVPPTPASRAYGERDFGVGYGRSSGYAARRQYVSGWNGQSRFRCS